MVAVKGPRLTSLTGLSAIGGLGTALLAVAAVVTMSAPATLTASAKADFTLAATPTSRTAPQGQAVSYTIDQTKLNGFKDVVSLSASNLPAGSSATFSPQTLDSKTTSTFAVTVGASTPAATYSNVTVTGTGGGITKSVTVSLTVTATTPPTFAVSASPASATMLPGDTAAYAIGTSTSNGFSGTIALSVAGAPAGATTTFTPASVAVGGSSSLQVATKNNTAGGSYTLTITGTSGTKTQSASVLLVIASSGKQFTITSGPIVVAGPGSSQPLNLSLGNPNSQALSITNLTVSVFSVTKAAGAPAGTCTLSDYAVAQFSGTYPLALPGGQTRTLSSLVPDSSRWPRLQMINRTTNQDACKGATLQLTFSGAGQG